MKEKDIQQLVDKFLAGETSPQEERFLAQVLQRPAVPQEWQVVRQMLGALTLGEAAYDSIVAKRRQRRALGRRAGWSAAVAAALMICFFVWDNSEREEATLPALAEQTTDIDTAQYASTANLALVPQFSQPVEADVAETLVESSEKHSAPAQSAQRPLAQAASRKQKERVQADVDVAKRMAAKGITMVHEPLFDGAMDLADGSTLMAGADLYEGLQQEPTSETTEQNESSADAIIAKMEAMEQNLREQRLRLRQMVAADMSASR